MHFLYIELPRTANEQKNLLVGKVSEIFGKTIRDQDAAIETIFSLFQKVELIYNQGKAKLLDESKRVSGVQIADALKVITTQSKAFDYWRDEGKSVSYTLEIKPFQRNEFESYFIASFDLFKSMTEAEHQKILKFVAENYENCNSTSEEGSVLELCKMYQSSKTTKFKELELKAVLYAAYFQVINKSEV